MNIVGRAAESRDKMLKETTGKGFSSIEQVARRYKERMDAETIYRTKQ